MKTLSLSALLLSVLFLTACSGPVVMIDQGHDNLHRVKKTLHPFVTALEDDGFNISESHGEVATVVLENRNVLVIATGHGFQDDEIATIDKWVREGGSLLLAPERSPSADFRKLASRFGADLSREASLAHGAGRVAVLADTTLLGEKRGGDPKRALRVVQWLSRE